MRRCLAEKKCGNNKLEKDRQKEGGIKRQTSFVIFKVGEKKLGFQKNGVLKGGKY